MNYQEMSDYEISCEVGRKISFADHILAKNKQVNYCNSWADAGRIAQEYKISIHAPRFGEGWMAEHTGSDEDVNDGFEVDYFEHHHENPCRAIWVVFLMMKGGE